MARNPHLFAVQQAERDDRTLLALINRYIGTMEHPRGQLLSAYRNARRGVREVLSRGGPLAAVEVDEVLAGLKRDLVTIGTEAVGLAAASGQQSAVRQVEAYRTAGTAIRVAGDAPEIGPLLEGLTAQIEGQLASVRGLARISSVGAVTGDAGRVGALAPGVIAKEMARVIAGSQKHGLESWLAGRDGRLLEEIQIRRQAVAAIDHRTTDTCLRVNGQIVEFKDDFTLTGTPRYADEQRDPPFHDWCRTSVALYHELYDDGLTLEMRSAANAELQARAAAQEKIAEHKAKLASLGAAPDVRIRKDDTKEIKEARRQLRIWRNREREVIWPSHARSRRDYKESFVG